MSTQVHAELEAIFGQKDYVRKRLSPRPGEPGYMHRADLLLALKTEATIAKLSILDYGSGVSPYRSLFPNSDYRSADIESLGDPDYLIHENGTVPEKSCVFDMVLSTQVLEHVSEPDNYLSECFRLLKPGGKLLLSTHGSYEDHGCPYDFRRWTADGLRYDLTKAGFEIEKMYKLTTGPRAVMFFMERYFYAMPSSRKTVPGLIHWMNSTVYRHLRGWLHTQMDRYYSAYRVLSSDVPGNNLYIAQFISARRSF